ncbi:MAG: DUF2203 domain-containing protein [Acidobacteria bacterium]|nr:DUF2203 domain-containing protein [Acidobacteriota bacterium]
MTNKYFSREEAEQLLPLIEESLKRAQSQKQTIDALQGDLTNAASRIMVLGGSFPPYADLLKKKSERDEMSAKIVESLAQIQQTGCVVKDLDEGLVDFPCMIDGQEAYLCWKLGESRIEYWHGLEEGFAGRKRIDSGPSETPPSGPTRVQ